MRSKTRRVALLPDYRGHASNRGLGEDPMEQEIRFFLNNMWKIYQAELELAGLPLAAESAKPLPPIPGFLNQVKDHPVFALLQNFIEQLPDDPGSRWLRQRASEIRRAA